MHPSRTGGERGWEGVWCGCLCSCVCLCVCMCVCVLYMAYVTAQLRQPRLRRHVVLDWPSPAVVSSASSELPPSVQQAPPLGPRTDSSTSTARLPSHKHTDVWLRLAEVVAPQQCIKACLECHRCQTTSHSAHQLDLREGAKVGFAHLSRVCTVMCE